jgi:hypothetical protein
MFEDPFRGFRSLIVDILRMGCAATDTVIVSRNTAMLRALPFF